MVGRCCFFFAGEGTGWSWQVPPVSCWGKNDPQPWPKPMSHRPLRRHQNHWHHLTSPRVGEWDLCASSLKSGLGVYKDMYGMSKTTSLEIPWFFWVGLFLSWFEWSSTFHRRIPSRGTPPSSPYNELYSLHETNNIAPKMVFGSLRLLGLPFGNVVSMLSPCKYSTAKECFPQADTPGNDHISHRAKRKSSSKVPLTRGRVSCLEGSQFSCWMLRLETLGIISNQTRDGYD